VTGHEARGKPHRSQSDTWPRNSHAAAKVYATHDHFDGLPLLSSPERSMKHVLSSTSLRSSNPAKRRTPRLSPRVQLEGEWYRSPRMDTGRGTDSSTAPSTSPHKPAAGQPTKASLRQRRQQRAAARQGKTYVLVKHQRFGEGKASSYELPMPPPILNAITAAIGQHSVSATAQPSGSTQPGQSSAAAAARAVPPLWGGGNVVTGSVAARPISSANSSPSHFSDGDGSPLASSSRVSTSSPRSPLVPASVASSSEVRLLDEVEWQQEPESPGAASVETAYDDDGRYVMMQ
jgi:hypothetical protein